jgi:hypothetical protein
MIWTWTKLPIALEGSVFSQQTPIPADSISFSAVAVGSAERLPTSRTATSYLGFTRPNAECSEGYKFVD